MSDTLAAVERFNEAFNTHNVDLIMSLMTDDVVFESTNPPPDGVRHEGAAAVRAAWEQLFADAPTARFDAEEVFASEDRAVVRWRFDWGDGHIRGVDVMRVRDGKVCEKFSYVKG